MTFEEALAALASLAPRGWRLGLDRMSELVRRAGLTESLGVNRPKYIHIGGTNGKGSVTATVQSILIEQGHRTGAFFSPFVYDPRERIQIDRELISKDDFARLTKWLMEIGAGLEETEFGGITEFELKTAMGFAKWSEAMCDWVALEVGLGGRFDATNVVNSAASVIVSIGWDHMAILGDSLEKIAYEKAGIIKPGIPLMLGPMAEGPRGVILDVAKERGSEVWEIGREIQIHEMGKGGISTPRHHFPEVQRSSISGVHQLQNTALAIAACDAAGAIVDPDKVVDGINKTRLPGRFEQRETLKGLVILDGAHNGEAADALAQNLDEIVRREGYVLLVGMTQGHDPERFFAPFAKLPIAAVHLVPIDFHRTQSPSDLEPAARKLTERVVTHESVREGVLAALDEGGTVIVTGSFYLVGEAGQIVEECGWPTPGRCSQ